MKRTALVCTCLLIAGCQSVGTSGKVYEHGIVSFEDEHIVVIDENRDRLPEDIYIKRNPGDPVVLPTVQAVWIAEGLTEGVIDDDEKKALRRLIGASVADLVSTQIGLNRGCVEGNPLFRGAPLVAVAWKAGVIAYTYHKMKSTPKINSISRPVNLAAGVTGAVAVRNLLLNCGT